MKQAAISTAAMSEGNVVNARLQGFRGCYHTLMLVVYEALGVKSARSLSLPILAVLKGLEINTSGTRSSVRTSFLRLK
jgi:hypothetical protein